SSISLRSSEVRRTLAKLSRGVLDFGRANESLLCDICKLAHAFLCDKNSQYRERTFLFMSRVRRFDLQSRRFPSQKSKLFKDFSVPASHQLPTVCGGKAKSMAAFTAVCCKSRGPSLAHSLMTARSLGEAKRSFPRMACTASSHSGRSFHAVRVSV